MAGVISYEVVRPSDGEVLARTETITDAESQAFDYAVVDEESILVRRSVPTEVDIIISVTHPSGAVFDTVGRGGRRTPAGTPR